MILLASVKEFRISALTDAALYGRSGSIRAFRLDGIKYALKNEKTVVKSKRSKPRVSLQCLGAMLPISSNSIEVGVSGYDNISGEHA